jgi:hypothetical protein
VPGGRDTSYYFHALNTGSITDTCTSHFLGWTDQSQTVQQRLLHDQVENRGRRRLR